MRRFIFSIILLLALCGNSWAGYSGGMFSFGFTWQQGRAAGDVPYSVFGLLTSLTPTKGAAGTFTRNTVQYNYAASASVTANNPMFETAGYLSEPASTNYFLNSASPVTQDISVTTANSGKWTVTVWGAGTVTTSAGTATATGYGVAQAGTPNTITVTVNGTAVFTVAGADATTKVNVENTANGTSFIATASASATRAATVASFPVAGNIPTTGPWAVKVAFTPKMAGTSSTAVRTLWSSYKDASNWVSLNYNGVILYAEINKAGVKEYVTKALSTTAGTTYNVVLKQENGRFFLYSQAAKGSDGLGAELITTPDFSSATGWALNGAGLSVSGGTGNFTAAGTGQNIQQNPMLAAIGKIFNVVFTVKAYSSGAVAPSLGGVLGTSRNANGTYTQAITTTTANEFFIRSVGTTTASIDDVSVKEISNSTTATAFTLGTTFEVGSFNGTQQAQANFSNLTIYGNLGDAKAISLATP